MNFLRFKENPIVRIPKMRDRYCFSNVTNYARDHVPEAEIVHGTAMMASGVRAPHAWIEDGNEVIDPTAGIITDKETYYSIVGAQPEARYTLLQAITNMARYNNHGPWH